MKMQLLLFTMLFYGCISPFSDQRIYSVPDELTYYYDSFVNDAKKHGINYSNADIVIQLVDFDAGLSGLHADRSDYIKQIQIDRDVYNANKSDTSTLKWLIYHELGHALLNRDHLQDCNSIMHPYFMMCSTQEFRVQESKMIEELFIGR